MLKTRMEKMQRQLLHVEQGEVVVTERVNLGSEIYIQHMGLLEVVEVPRQSLVDPGGLEPLVVLILIAATTRQCNVPRVLVEMWA
jgi:hypothetical protein